MAEQETSHRLCHILRRFCSHRSFLFLALISSIFVSLPPPIASAQSPFQTITSKSKKSLHSDGASDGLDEYLARARQWVDNYSPSAGSLWNPDGRLADVSSDTKARVRGDEVTIQLVEATNSSQQGTVQTQRTLAASSNISAFFGVPGSRSAMQNIFSPNSSQALNGKGQTTLQTSLTTSLSGNIVEALPNGYMVVEATRDVNISDQRQTLVLRGIIRREDISPANVVLSSSISQLEVSMKGKGVISDGTRQPNVLVRFMLRILGF
ncbi:MAG TPA: flagellar basal body L-ring protein FlgH [Candidatus Aquilonibacter sp.]|nr:flagellar basal body L-ring protein FlgH [Candidatus Aquilonibacter sp.]